MECVSVRPSQNSQDTPEGPLWGLQTSVHTTLTEQPNEPYFGSVGYW